MIGASLSLANPGKTLRPSPLARVPGAELFARFDDAHGVGGVFYAQGKFKSASEVMDNIPDGQPTHSGLQVLGEGKNFFSHSDVSGPSWTAQSGGGALTITPGFPDSKGGMSACRVQIDASAGGSFPRLTAAGAAMSTSENATVSFEVKSFGGTPQKVGIYGPRAGIVEREVTAEWTTIEYAQTAASPSVAPGLCLRNGVLATLSCDILVSFAMLEDATSVAGPAINSDGAPTTRSAAAPTLVQGAGPTVFPGVSDRDELTLAIEWAGVPAGTGTERALLTLQAQADYGVSENNRATLFYQTDGSLTLGVADTVWRGGVNVGTSFEDGGLHRATVYLNRLAGDIALSVDGAAFLTENKAGVMPTSFDVAAIGHNKSGPNPTHQSGGHHLEIAAAGGDHREVWR